MDFQALYVSLKLASLTTAVLFVVGMPIAYWLAFSPRRWKFVVEAVVALPLVLPPTVLGFYLLVGLGPRSPLGRWIESLFDTRLVFTFQGLVVASVIYSLPFAVQPFANAFSSVDRKLIEASWSLGLSRPMTFFKVVLPLSITGIVSGLVLAFAHTLGEFGVALMVGGSIPGVTKVASIAIYDDVDALAYQSAARMSLVLLAIAFAILLIVHALRRARIFST